MNEHAVNDEPFIGPCAKYINLVIIKKEQLHQEEDITRTTLHGGVDEILWQKEKVYFENILSQEANHPTNTYLWMVHQALARVYLHGSYVADGMSYKKCNNTPLLCF